MSIKDKILGQSVFGMEIHTAVEVKPDTLYMIPGDIMELIKHAKAGLLSWDFVIEEAVNAAREGRIGVITNIG